MAPVWRSSTSSRNVHDLSGAVEGSPRFLRPGARCCWRFPGLRVLFAMREEFIAELDPYLALLPERLRTPIPPRAECASAGRSRRSSSRWPHAGRSFPKTLPRGARAEVARRAEVIRTGRDGTSASSWSWCSSRWSARAYGRVSAPELRPSPWTTWKKYADVDRALTRFYETCIREAADGGWRFRVGIRSWFNNVLITRMETRALIPWDRDRPDHVPNQVVELLDKVKHILRVEARNNAFHYELAMTAFIKPISRVERVLAKGEGEAHASGPDLPCRTMGQQRQASLRPAGSSRLRRR